MKLLRKFIGYKLIKAAPLPDQHADLRHRLVSIITHAQNTHSPYKKIYTRFLKSEPDLTDEEFFYAFSHLPILEKDDLILSYERQKRPLNPAQAIFQENKLYPKTISALFKHAFSNKNYTALFPAYKTESDELCLKYTSRKELSHYINGYLETYRKQGWKQGEPITFIYPHSALVPHFFNHHAEFVKKFFGVSFICIDDTNRDNIGEVVQESLRTDKCNIVATSPTTLFYIAQNMRRTETPPCTKALRINLSGQALSDCSRFFIQEYFPESEIQSSYTTLTCGSIAHQKALNSFEYDVQSNRVHLEQGPNNTILLTSFFPRQFPLIRYKITDTGRIVTHEDGTQSIMPLEGKSDKHIVNSKDYLFFASYFNDVINRINRSMNDPVIFFSVRHDKRFGKQYLRLNCIVKDESKNEKIALMAWEILSKTFPNYHYIDVKFQMHTDQILQSGFRIVDKKDGFAQEIEDQEATLHNDTHIAPPSSDDEDESTQSKPEKQAAAS